MFLKMLLGNGPSDNYVSIIIKYKFNDESRAMVLSWLRKPPYDGHKKNITDKSHNFVGIGYYLSGKQFRYYEEFIDRYFEFENIPSEVRVDEPFHITVKTKGESFYTILLFIVRIFLNL